MSNDQPKLTHMAAGPSQYPDEGIPEIAFVGRSNVGKSSLLNGLLGRKKLAYTSSKPGKTRTINFYWVNDSVYFVDLPGYGYAQAAKTTRADWEKQMMGYLRNRKELAGIVQLIDSRHDPQKLDLEIHKSIVKLEIPFLLAATKRDKISANQWQKNAAVIRKSMMIRPEQLYPVSVFDKDSLFALRKGIANDLLGIETES